LAIGGETSAAEEAAGGVIGAARGAEVEVELIGAMRGMKGKVEVIVVTRGVGEVVGVIGRAVGQPERVVG
jgi:hypothetical protein